MRYLLILGFFLIGCGGGGDSAPVANVTASNGANVSVSFDGSGSVDQSIQNVTQNCLQCCIEDEIDSACLESLDVSCAIEDFEGSTCEAETMPTAT